MPLMLPNAPQYLRYTTTLPSTPSATPGVTVNNPVGAAHTKDTTWTQLVASVGFDVHAMVILIQSSFQSSVNTSVLLDIGIGAAAAETALISDICAGFAGSIATAGTRSHEFPIYIPSGSRISARTQSVRTSGSVTVSIDLFGGRQNPDATWSGQHVTTYGADLATSAGTAFTPGNSGAAGTGVQIGTTTAAHKALVLTMQGGPGDTSWVAGNMSQFDIGIDSSSTEWIESSRFLSYATNAEQLGTCGIWMPIYRNIPSGTQLMIRGTSSGTADAFTAVIHGIS
jgi:hypothetical protein